MAISWLMCHLLLREKILLSLLVQHDHIFHIQVPFTNLIQFYSISLIKNLIMMMQKQSCLLWWNLLMPLMGVNWFDTKSIKLSHVTVKRVGPSSAPTERWWGILMTVILDLILLERSSFCIRMPKGQSQKDQWKVSSSCVLMSIWIHSFIEFIYVMFCTHVICFFTWIQCLYEFFMSIWIHFFIEFIYVLLRTHVILFYMNSMLVWIHLTTSVFFWIHSFSEFI